MRRGKLGSAIMNSFWLDKRVFLTGHTGFKGSWLSIWLSSRGANVKGYSLAPSSNNNLFEIAGVDELVSTEINDVRNYSALLSSMQEHSPDIVIHMAAQPLVRESYERPLETYEVNVMGTANLLEASRHCPTIRAVINVTTDKCYENKEWLWGYKETDPMGGRDPYSSSKGCAELVTSAYRDSFLYQSKVGVATARAGNVIGGGDWAQDRLIPDILKSFDLDEPVRIRNPSALRPWQHVLEPLSGYLILAERLFEEPLKYSGSWNFGPHDQDVQQVDWIVDRMAALWGGAKWDLDEDDNPHEAVLLKLDISKAVSLLGWNPTWSMDATLGKIIHWHKAWKSGRDMGAACISEIRAFEEDEKVRPHK